MAEWRQIVPRERRRTSRRVPAGVAILLGSLVVSLASAQAQGPAQATAPAASQAAGIASVPTRATLTPARVSAKPLIDGRLDDSIWSQATRVPLPDWPELA